MISENIFTSRNGDCNRHLRARFERSLAKLQLFSLPSFSSTRPAIISTPNRWSNPHAPPIFLSGQSCSSMFWIAEEMDHMLLAYAARTHILTSSRPRFYAQKLAAQLLGRKIQMQTDKSKPKQLFAINMRGELLTSLRS